MDINLFSRRSGFIALALLSACTGSARADIAVLNLGTARPLTTVPAGPSAGWPVTYAPFDTRPTFVGPGFDFLMVSDVQITAETRVVFGEELQHRRTLGEGWPAWRDQEYVDLYSTPHFEVRDRIDITVDSSVGVDYFELHALGGDAYLASDFTVTAFDSAGGMISSTQSATLDLLSGGAAVGWAFWTTAGETIQRISVSTTDSWGLVLGEFGVREVPSPGSAAILGMAWLAGSRRRRR